MVSISEIVAQLRQKGITLKADAPSLGRYGNSRESSARLIDLIINGEKRATTSLWWSYEVEGEPLATAGTIEIVLDWDERPVAILRYMDVFVVPFNEVTADYAFAEGENDRSLEQWRKSHWEFFRKECQGINRLPTDDMPVVCVRFELVEVL